MYHIEKYMCTIYIYYIFIIYFIYLIYKILYNCQMLQKLGLICKV